MPTRSVHTTATRASRMIGTPVYNNGEVWISELKDVTVDKTLNHIMVAAASSGGLSGIGERCHALPWSMLDHANNRDGYVVPLPKDQLELAPAQNMSDLTKNEGRGPRGSSYEYCRVNRDGGGRECGEVCEALGHTGIVEVEIHLFACALQLACSSCQIR